jgi:neuronal cell adhesion protein
MSPWANYTFRVIAKNKVGESSPSGHSKTCQTPADVPFKNPDNVEGRGSSPTNLIISWTVSTNYKITTISLQKEI